MSYRVTSSAITILLGGPLYLYLLSNCSYNPIISRVTIIMGLIFRL